MSLISSVTQPNFSLLYYVDSCMYQVPAAAETSKAKSGGVPLHLIGLCRGRALTAVNADKIYPILDILILIN